jgi:hypothetical protein
MKIGDEVFKVQQAVVQWPDQYRCHMMCSGVVKKDIDGVYVQYIAWLREDPSINQICRNPDEWSTTPDRAVRREENQVYVRANNEITAMHKELDGWSLKVIKPEWQVKILVEN